MCNSAVQLAVHMRFYVQCTWLRSIMSVFVVYSCIGGHHISQPFWNPRIDETLSCKREEGNSSDPFAVAIFQSKNSRVLGHACSRKDLGRVLFVSAP